jgi:hypothetical protein
LAPSLFLCPVTVTPTMTKCKKLSFTVSDFLGSSLFLVGAGLQEFVELWEFNHILKQRKTRGWSRELTSGQWLLIPQLQGLEDQRREAIICLCQLELQVSRGGKHAGRLASAACSHWLVQIKNLPYSRCNVQKMVAITCLQLITRCKKAYTFLLVLFN